MTSKIVRFPEIKAFSARLSACTILHSERWPAGSGEIILTFDDGPNGDGISDALLDVLQKHKVPAAFGLIGESVRAFPHIARRIYRQGHDIINHTDSHKRPLLSGAALDSAILRADRAIASALSYPDYRSTQFRPPYGLITPAIHFSAEARKRHCAYLTFYVDDAAVEPSTAEQLIQSIKQRLVRFNGGAIVLHELCHPPRGSQAPDRSWLPSAVEKLITWAHERKMTFTKYGWPKTTHSEPYDLDRGAHSISNRRKNRSACDSI